MIGKLCGVIALNKDDNYPELLPIYCVIHHEHLAPKYYKYDLVMKTVLEIVNFICASVKTHSHF